MQIGWVTPLCRSDDRRRGHLNGMQPAVQVPLPEIQELVEFWKAVAPSRSPARRRSGERPGSPASGSRSWPWSDDSPSVAGRGSCFLSGFSLSARLVGVAEPQQDDTAHGRGSKQKNTEFSISWHSSLAIAADRPRDTVDAPDCFPVGAQCGNDAAVDRLLSRRGWPDLLRHDDRGGVPQTRLAATSQADKRGDSATAASMPRPIIPVGLVPAVPPQSHAHRGASFRIRLQLAAHDIVKCPPPLNNGDSSVPVDQKRSRHVHRVIVVLHGVRISPNMAHDHKIPNIDMGKFSRRKRPIRVNREDVSGFA